MQLVLNRGEQGLGSGGAAIVVQAGGVNIGALLLELALAEVDLPDFFQQTLKVILAQEGPVLHPGLVQHIPLDGELAQHPGRPLAELGSAQGIYPVADGDDDVVAVRETCSPVVSPL